MKEAIFFCIVGLPLFDKEGSGTPVLKILVRALGKFVCLFVCSVDLRPKSTAIVMAGWSFHLTTYFPGHARTSS